MSKFYRFSDEDLARMAAMREAGQTCGQIARKFGCTAGLVNYYCMKLGADHPKGHAAKPSKMPMLTQRGGKPVRRFTEEEDRKLRAWRAEGVSTAEICRRLGRLNSSIRNRLLTLAMHDLRREASRG